MMRLDKFLCEMGVGTRSEVKGCLKKGQVTVNGDVIKKPETKIDESKDIICFLGQTLAYEAVQYFLLNKPAGCVTATRDNLSETVMSFLPENRRDDLFPVGRLDKDTEGLLLITNDGQLAHELLSPKKHVDKTYFARIDGEVKEEHIQQFLDGVDIGDDDLTMPAKLKIISSGDISEIELTIQEGRFHQVKRMFEAVGTKVIYLKRISMGPLVLGDLQPGKVRVLTDEEIEQLRNR
ncbi:MAG: rRNA pseudouridine synthase [Lachnospiraceae bacterium]|nr:rRNA pseudouridine synthase [Lachnospiraceae bacterium]